MTEPEPGVRTDRTDADETPIGTTSDEPFDHDERDEREDRPTPAEGLPAFSRFLTGLLRVVVGFYFLWAFVDKTFGLEYATPPENAWLDGGSPTTGYLSNVDGPFAEYFNEIAGEQWADWLFMIGLLGIGLAFLLGIGVRIAAFFGFILLMLMYLASLPTETNPAIDDHVMQALVVALLGAIGAGSVWGLGKMWRRTRVVSRNRWLI